MILLNFTHRLTPAQLQQIEALAGGAAGRIIDAPAHFDTDRPFGEQARDLVNGIEITPEEWETAPLLVNLPSLSVLAGLVLAEIHGRRGHFPAIVRLRPVTSALGTVFEPAEIINLQAARESARALRQS